MKDSFYPFKKKKNGCEKKVSELECSDLAELRSVSEGWFVEYKSDIIDTKKIAKSISSFANQYGGWLIFGIKEDKKMPKEFPGIDELGINKIIEELREASRNVLNPEVFYEHKIINGPCENIGLDKGKSILIVRIPSGTETPYIHSDGRIYLRIGDSSDPKYLTDRFTLERLIDRSNKYKNKIKKKVEKVYSTSVEEKNNSYLNLFIFSDPYGIKNDPFSYSFEEYSSIMKGEPIPFDNNFSTSSGFISRQTTNNNPYHRLFTWELDSHFTSYVTIPFNVLSLHDPKIKYENWSNFCHAVSQKGYKDCKILDLNMLFIFIRSVISRHLKLIKPTDISDPFYVKISINNIWRTIPFIDSKDYITQIKNNGCPINQENDITMPPDYELKNFIKLFYTTSEEEEEEIAIEAFYLLLPILNSLGIPMDSFIDKNKSKEEIIKKIADIFSLEKKSKQNQESRS